MEGDSLPHRLSAAELAVAEANVERAKGELAASIASRDALTKRLAHLQTLAAKVAMAIEESRIISPGGTIGPLPDGAMERVREELGYNANTHHQTTRGLQTEEQYVDARANAVKQAEQALLTLQSSQNMAHNYTRGY